MEEGQIGQLIGPVAGDVAVVEIVAHHHPHRGVRYGGVVEHDAVRADVDKVNFNGLETPLIAASQDNNFSLVAERGFIDALKEEEN